MRRRSRSSIWVGALAESLFNSDVVRDALGGVPEGLGSSLAGVCLVFGVRGDTHLLVAAPRESRLRHCVSLFVRDHCDGADSATEGVVLSSLSLSEAISSAREGRGARLAYEAVLRLFERARASTYSRRAADAPGASNNRIPSIEVTIERGYL